MSADLETARKLRLCSLLSHLALIPVSPPPPTPPLLFPALLSSPSPTSSSFSHFRRYSEEVEALLCAPLSHITRPLLHHSPLPHICRYSAEVEALLEPFVYEWTTERDGSISAEHGVRLAGG